MLRTIRIRLKEIAEQKPVSMSKLSRMSDVSYDTIQQIYHSPSKDVNLSTLEKLAEALEIDICDLFERVKEASDTKKVKKVADTPEKYPS